ncbi:hypothetical protein AYI86_05835 [Shewanella algae]|nr:hypothetical protein AYI86_05835 [Shewanella algae]
MVRPLQRALPAVGKRVPKEGPMAHQEDSDKEQRPASSTTPVDDCFSYQLKQKTCQKITHCLCLLFLQLPSNKCPK